MRFARSFAAAGLYLLLIAAASAPPAGAAQIVQIDGLSVPGPSLPGEPEKYQKGRLTPDAQPSSCDPSMLKLEPVLREQTTDFAYSSPTLQSSLAHPVCVTITINANCGGGKQLFSVSYLGKFDPNDLLAGYLGDLGTPTSTSRSYSYVLPARAAWTLVVHETGTGTACSGGYGYRATSRGPWAESAPGIGDVAAVGEPLTGTDAAWSEPPLSVNRHWLRCDGAGESCTEIAGATGPTYTVTNADLGHTLRYRNAATDADGTNWSDSEFVEPFIPFEERAAASLGAGDRALSGAFARAGRETRCGSPTPVPPVLTPAPNLLYDAYPVRSLLNQRVCLVVRTDPACAGGVTPMIYAPAFDPVAGITANYAGNSPRNPSFVSTVSVPLPAGEAREAVVSRGFSGGMSPCASYDVSLGADAPFATARPTVTGAGTGPYTSTAGTWSGSPALRRSWLRCNAAGVACAPIPGGTGASYTPTAADSGRRLRVRVTATQGRAVSSDSEPTGLVPPRPPAGRGGTTPPPADRTAPVVTLRLGSRNLAKAVRTGRIPVRVTCDERCRASVQVRVTKRLAKKLRLRRKVVLAKAKGSVPAGSRKTLRAKLTRGARRALRRRRSVKVQLRATFADAAGNRANKRGRGALKRPRRR